MAIEQYIALYTFQSVTTRDKTMNKYAITLATLALAAGSAQAASVSFTDTLGASYSQFNGFESIGTAFPVGSTYTEDGISVNQVHMGQYGIFTRYTGNGAHTGRYSWYPNGGDNGYTRITEQSGVDFSAVSLKTGNGGGGTSTFSLNYELRNNGLTVLSGSAQQSAMPFVVSFTGGGFDEVLLSATYGSGNGVTSGAFQGLAIDDIKVNPVPEPETYAMLLAGLGVMGAMARRRKAKQA